MIKQKIKEDFVSILGKCSKCGQMDFIGKDGICTECWANSINREK